MSDAPAAASLPWIVALRRRILAGPEPQALLVHGPSGVGQFELALQLAAAWLCEDDALPRAERPCGTCASCRLFAAHSHPDFLLLLPAALRESLGWSTAGDDDNDDKATKKKPSRDIRVEAVRAAIEFATTTSARGRSKVVVVHPAERMNPIAANALLKTLEEPAGATRFVLCTAAPDALLPTIRSRCQAIALPVPATLDALAWLQQHGVGDGAETLLAACGGQPQEVLSWRALGIDGAAWRALPGRVARGEAAALSGWPLPLVIDMLQKVCHDAAAATCGAPPRYFPAGDIPARADLAALLRWARELRRVAEFADHPWNEGLSIESLVEQGRQALKTPRSAGREPRTPSLHSGR